MPLNIRLSKSNTEFVKTCLSIILFALLNLLNQDRRHGWGAPIKALVFLFWLASGAAYWVVSRVFAIPRSTVHRIVHRVTEVVVATRHQVIHLPRTPKDQDAMSNGFAQLAGHRAFVKAAGAIDCCHVRIKPTSGPDAQCYRNRKLFPSIILQAVCDHQGYFIDTYVGWPGSVHDSRVLRNSPFTLLQGTSSLQMEGTHVSSIHSTSSLPTRGQSKVLEPCALTPIIPKARSIIDRAFGMIKTRFFFFLQAQEVHHTFVPHVITACAILHNICLGVGNLVALEDEPEDDAQEGEAGLEAGSGALWWDSAICRGVCPGGGTPGPRLLLEGRYAVYSALLEC
uniref:DDE Tnp4 domain-containing protein n=1 Tax=Maylandia zebra TaxID=106582 RepID=A0A3P9D1X9_9CICH